MTKGKKKNNLKKNTKKSWNPKSAEELMVKYIAEKFSLS